MKINGTRNAVDGPNAASTASTWASVGIGVGSAAW